MGARLETKSGVVTCRLDGVVGDHVTLGQDTAGTSLTGDIEVEAEFSADDFTPSSERTIVSKWSDLSNDRGWRLNLTTTGQINFLFSTNGSGNAGNHTSTSFTAPADGSFVRVKASRVQSTGVTSIFQYISGAWVSIFTSAANSVGTGIFNNAAPLSIGAYNYGAANVTSCGLNIKNVYLRDAAGGTVVASCDFTAMAADAEDANPPTKTRKFTDAQANQWYIVSSNAVLCVDLGERLGGGVVMTIVGSAGTTPDSALLSPTGDIDVRVECRLFDYTPGSNGALAGKMASATVGSWIFRLTTAGTLQLLWNDSGGTQRTAAASSVAVTTVVADGDRYWFRATLDVDNGASNHEVKYWTSPDNVTWTQLGTTQNAGTGAVTTVRDSADVLAVGSWIGNNGDALIGVYYNFEFYSGIAGTLLANPDFENATTTIFADSKSNLWTTTLTVADSLRTGEFDWDNDECLESAAVYGIGTLTVTTGVFNGNGKSADFLPEHVGRRIIHGGVQYLIAGYTTSNSITLIALSGGTAISTVAGRMFGIGGRNKTFAGGSPALSVVPGDRFRVKKSADPVDTGLTADWTKVDTTKNEFTFPNSTVTNASPAVVATAVGSGSPPHNLVVGDIIQVLAVATNTAFKVNQYYEVETVPSSTTFTAKDSSSNTINLGGGGTINWTWKKNRIVKLSSAVTQTLEDGQSATSWVASANVTISAATNGVKFGVNNVRVNVAAGFTTGKLGYKTYSPALDLSTLQQISAWWQSSITHSAGVISLKLCSDTTGDTPVASFQFPASLVNGIRQQAVWDNGTALAASVQSIALYMDVDTTVVYDFGFIMASKAPGADAITLATLLGHANSVGAGGDDSDTFYGLQWVHGLFACLDNHPDATPLTNRGWSADASIAAGALWKQEPTKVVAPGSLTGVIAPLEGGTVLVPTGNVESTVLRTKVTTGWDATSMNEQTGRTWLDGTAGFGVVVTGSAANVNYLVVDELSRRLGAVRYTTGVAGSQGWGCHIGVLSFGNMTNADNGYPAATGGNTLSAEFFVNCNTGFINLGLSATGHVKVNHARNNISSNVSITGAAPGSRISTISGRGTFRNSGSSSVIVTGNSHVDLHNFDMYENNVSGAADVQGLAANFNALSSIVRLHNCSLNSITPVLLFAIAGGVMPDTGSAVYSFNHGNVKGTQRVWREAVSILPDTSVADGSSSSRHRFDFVSTTLPRSAQFPLNQVVGTVKVNDAESTTLTFRVQRTSLNIYAALAIKAPQGSYNQLTDVVGTPANAAVNTWQDLSVTFTPTSDGEVDVSLITYPGQPAACSLYLGDFAQTAGGVTHDDAATLAFGMLDSSIPNVIDGGGSGGALGAPNLSGGLL